jgi:hypothetical protein
MLAENQDFSSSVRLPTSTVIEGVVPWLRWLDADEVGACFYAHTTLKMLDII